jgi:histidyl-tRNA synthetase
MELTAVRGMHDSFGEELARWRHVESVVRDVLERYGYREIRTPAVEKLDVFKAVGDETDIVEKQMFLLQTPGGDRAEKDVLCLRPEGTAAFVRAVVEHRLGAPGATGRFYYALPMFRYERPQKGRLRQFHQIGIECIHDPSPGADAETIACLDDVYRAFGLTRYEIRLNSVGCAECRPAYTKLLVAYFEKRRGELCEQCQKRLERAPLRVLDCKNESCRKLAAEAPKLFEHLDESCRAHHAGVEATLRAAGVRYVNDPQIVRGLDYYRRTAFEFQSDLLGAQSALGGGGRYDGLAGRFGGDPTFTAVGWALGVERLLIALEASGYFTDKTFSRGPLVHFVPIGTDAYEKLLALSFDLRRRGIAAQIAYAPEKAMKWHMKQADRAAARFALIAGETELAQGKAQLKELATGTQSEVPFADLEGWLRARDR